MTILPIETWTPENLTARMVVAHRELVLMIHCVGCRCLKEIDPWRIASRCADDPLRDLRWRCDRCGVYARELTVERRTASQHRCLLVIPIASRCWDAGHQDAQQAALRRARPAK